MLERELILSFPVPHGVTRHGPGWGLQFEIELLWEPIKKEQSQAREPEDALLQSPGGK